MRGISLWSHLQKSFVFVLLWPKKRPTKCYRSNVTLMSGNLSACCPTSNYFSSIHCVSIVCPYVYSSDWHHKIDTLLTFWRCHLADTCGNMSTHVGKNVQFKCTYLLKRTHADRWGNPNKRTLNRRKDKGIQQGIFFIGKLQAVLCGSCRPNVPQPSCSNYNAWLSNISLSII